MALTLKVNGKEVTVDAEPGTPLLWVLREKLGLLGTKYGCGQGLCGACTVHINGAAVRSCLMPLAAVSGVDANRRWGIKVAGFYRWWVTWRGRRGLIWVVTS